MFVQRKRSDGIRPRNSVDFGRGVWLGLAAIKSTIIAY
jgi:hypothetical protein